MTAKLVVLAGPLCGETFPVDFAEITVGRDASSRLSIPDNLMSRRHCAISLASGRYTLHDLGSSNGTYVNGIPVRERVLEHGDRIRAGNSVLLFLTPEPGSVALPIAGSDDPPIDNAPTQPIERPGADDRPRR